MKNLKLIIILMTATFAVANVVAMEQRSSTSAVAPIRRAPSNFSWEEIEEAAHQQTIAYEKKVIKPAKEIASISALNQLMLQESNEIREFLLNTLPREIKEYLIRIIDDRKNLLNVNLPNEAALVNDLNTLRQQINNNLGQ